jgi:hypothetical protein
VSKSARDTITDLETTHRLQQLLPLTQRTDLLRQLLGLKASNQIIGNQAKLICEQMGIEYRPPRGAMPEMLKKASLVPEARYHISAILAPVLELMRDQPIDSLTPSGSKQASHHIVDLLVTSFRRHVRILGTTPRELPVSFEQIYIAWQALACEDTGLEQCSNCDSTYLVNNLSATSRCPVCRMHGHPNYSAKLGLVEKVNPNSADRIYKAA